MEVNKVHSVPMGLVRFWMEEAREYLGLDEAKGWAIHKWTERRLNRNALPHLPNSRHKRHKEILTSEFDNLVDKLCLDECKGCLNWIEKVLHRQSGWHTYEDKMYILSFHPDRVKQYNDIDNKYIDFTYPWAYNSEIVDETLIRLSPWDWTYDEGDWDNNEERKRYKRLHDKFVHITKSDTMAVRDIWTKRSEIVVAE